MDGCIYRTKDGECDLYAEGGKFTAFCDMDGCEGRKLSNGDKIRAMSDEKLAKFLYEETDYPKEEHWLDWLRQEAE